MKNLPIFLGKPFTTMNTCVMMITSDKEEQTKGRKEMDEKQQELHTAMVNAAYEYKFEGGSKKKAEDACMAYAKYRGIDYERACKLAVECF